MAQHTDAQSAGPPAPVTTQARIRFDRGAWFPTMIVTIYGFTVILLQTFFKRLGEVVTLGGTALKRLRSQPGLAICALTALVTSVAVSVSIPIYAEGASLRLLQSELARQELRTQRSAFVFLFRFIGTRSPAEWEQMQTLDSYLSQSGFQSIGLPLQGVSRYVRSVPLQLFVPQGTTSNDWNVNGSLRNVSVGFLSGMETQMHILEGQAPKPFVSADGPIEVMISRKLADEVGINVGDQFAIVGRSGSRTASIPVRVSAIWTPANPDDPAWFLRSDSFDDVMLTSEQTFSTLVRPKLRNEVAQAVWYARLNGTALPAGGALSLLDRVEELQARSLALVQGVNLEQSPIEPLTRYRDAVQALVIQLSVFSVPILGLVLYFSTLIANLMVQRQRGEIALLKTRGVRNTHILSVYAIEWTIMGALALVLGPIIGRAFAIFMAQSTSFLQLRASSRPLLLELSWFSLQFGFIAVGLTMVASLIPAFIATRRTLVDEQQQMARVLQKPFWQRLYLDIFLFLPPLYGIYQLQQNGNIGPLGSDPVANPLLMFVPVLFCLSLGMFAIRVIPVVFEALARLSKLPGWIAPLMAFRSLARQPGFYRGALLLLMLTLSLAAFSASMAATLDGGLYASIHYQIGADTQLIEAGQTKTQRPGSGQPGRPGSQPQPQPSATATTGSDEARFLFVPVSEHLTVKGITGAARVGSYPGTVQKGGRNTAVQLVGIDRLEFPSVVKSFDPAWAGGQSLGALMNQLAQTPHGIIVTKDALDKGIVVGGALPVDVDMFGDKRRLTFRVIAAVDLWPGFYPQDGPILIANMDYLFDQMGSEYPYDVWITRDQDASLEDLARQIRALGVTLVDVRDADTLIHEQQEAPQRQGLFGLLSVGFLVSSLLTLLGFMISALITARRRSIELGMLRAMGMKRSGAISALAVEQVTLVTTGITAGTGIGILVAQVVVPLFQVGVGPHPGTPPYVARIAWEQTMPMYLTFALALLLTLAILIWILGRMPLFQAVKLGDAN